MKRKLSLLMAAVMVLSAIPFTATEVQASTTNRTHGIPGTTVPNNTVFIERQVGLTGGGPGFGFPATNRARAFTTELLPANLSGGTGAAYGIEAGYLELELRTIVNPGDQFRLELENGEWMFRSTALAAQMLHSTPTPDGGNLVNIGAPVTDIRSLINHNSARFDGPSGSRWDNPVNPTGANAGVANNANDWNFPHGAGANADIPRNPAMVNLVATPTDIGNIYGPHGTNADAFGFLPDSVRTMVSSLLNMPLSALSTQGLAADVHRIGAGVLPGVAAGSVPALDRNLIGRTYDISRGFYVHGTPGAEGTYVRFANPVRDTLGRSPGAAQSDWEIPYFMEISRIAANRTEATVTLLGGGSSGDIILVPIIIRVPSSEGAILRLLPHGHNAFVTQGNWHIAAAGPIATAAHVENPHTSRDRFVIEELVIRELRANSIRRLGGDVPPTTVTTSNAFDLVLPSGFYFDNAALPSVDIFLERDLTWGPLPIIMPANSPRTAAGSPGWGIRGFDFDVFFPAGHQATRDRLRVRLNNFNESHTIAGSMSIEGLVIWAEENAPFDIDIELRIENTDFISVGTGWQLQDQQGMITNVAAPAGWTRLFAVGNDLSTADLWIRPRTDGTFDVVNNSTPPDPRGTWVSLTEASAMVMGDSWISVANLAAIGTNFNAPDAILAPPGQWGQTWTSPGFISSVAEMNNQNMVTEQTIRAGTRRDWGVVLRTEGAIPELISGRYEGPTSMPVNAHHQTARIVFEEVVPNSWWAGRQVILSLPEEVRWRRVWFEELNYPPNSGNQNRTIAAGPNTIQRRNYYVNIAPGAANQNPAGRTDMHAVAGPASARTHGVHFDANRMYWTEVLAWRGSENNNRNRGAYLRFDAWVSIAAHFEGEIVLTAHGSAVPHAIDSNERPAPSTVIATAIPPVRVDVEHITDVRIGFQNQPTANITITETRPGALMRGRQVRLSVTDLIATDILFGPNVNIEVTEANGFTIRNIGTGLAGSLYGLGDSAGTPTLGIEANRGTLSFEVASVSHTNPATITVSNVSVRVDRTVPETNETPYWVVVWGDAVANNFGHFDTRPLGQSDYAWPMWERTNFDRFQNYPGIFTDYVRVVTGGDGSPWLTQEVRVTIGELYYTVNGVPYEMDAAAILDPVSESTFVPLRFISNAFGLQDDRDIVWDPHNRAVTLTLPTGRVVQFQVDSPVMLDNGAPRTVVNANGDAITPMMVTVDAEGGARMFLPFRFFGEVVLGVEVGWEAATQTAIFNPSGNVGGN